MERMQERLQQLELDNQDRAKLLKDKSNNETHVGFDSHTDDKDR